MIEYLVLLSCAGFLAFLIPGRHRKYAAITGWIFIVLTLFAELPEFFKEYNFMYPLIAAMSVPFLAITIKYLLINDERAINISRAAAVAFLIYAPFGFTQVPLFAWLGDQLISMVVGQVIWILEALNYTVSLTCMNVATERAMDPAACGDLLRDTITRNGYSVQIVLGCTGIQSIAILLGVAAAVPTTVRQKCYAFLIIVLPIYFLNLLRNAFVIMAYTDQWFPYYPDIASNGEPGYESFFWAHNVIMELLALVILVMLAYWLFTLIPRLGKFADELYQMYTGEIRKAFGKGR
ncbi:MAG: archaeosortase A [Methanoregula sp.]|jgi:archaeosortase A (PGF-CTERM-specific)|uniref:archaeosortase A n=1 Tax=Methanoregula sp. TaxID=2052170 RepID=UPI0025E3C29A|nr:archaeosortase A [Methanoregula sp.]MCK9630942.1 archaeosortase A [Methanoregula sp.]